MTTRCLTSDQAAALIEQATIDQLFAALAPHGPALENGGPCPTCGADAWPLDQLIWTCDGGPRHRDLPRGPQHRGTIFQLRQTVLANPDAIARLADADRISGLPLTQHDRPLPAVVDDWATPADLFRLHLTAGLDYDDQKAWCRQFAEAHGSQLLLELLDLLEQPALTGALEDVRTILREHHQEAAAA